MDICKDRDCRQIVRSIDAFGDHQPIPADLPPGDYFWRVQATIGGKPSGPVTVAWQIRHLGAAHPGGGYGLGSMLDVNGDGCSDLALEFRLGPERKGDARVLYGGPSGLSAKRSARLVGLGSSMRDAYLASAGDLDGDGFGDVVVGEPAQSHGTVYVLRGSSSGLSATPEGRRSGWREPTSNGARFCTGGDLDGDGRDDVGVIGLDPAEVDIRPSGLPSRVDTRVEVMTDILTSRKPVVPITVFGFDPCVILGGVDGHDHADLIATVPHPTVEKVPIRDQCAELQIFGSQAPLPPPCAIYSWLDGGDFDGDGTADLALLRPMDRDVATLVVASSSAERPPREVTFVPAMPYRHPVLSHTVTDVNGDQRSDLIMSPPVGGEVWIAFGTPDGLASPSRYEVPEAMMIRGSGDFDCDGDGDVALIGLATGRVYVYSLSAGRVIQTAAIDPD